jgi:malonyl CoA-acyl carrier protein transacylase
MVSSKEKIRMELIETRLSLLDSISHTPVDWEKKIDSLEKAYERLYNLIKDKIGE